MIIKFADGYVNTKDIQGLNVWYMDKGVIVVEIFLTSFKMTEHFESLESARKRKEEIHSIWNSSISPK